MANSDWDEGNPYASPKGIVKGPAQREPAEDRDEFVIEPGLPVGNWIDWIDGLSLSLVALERSLLLSLWFLSICAGACWWLGGLEPERVLIGMGIAVALLLLVGIYDWCRRVRRLRVDRTGVWLERRPGKSTFLAWEHVRRIRPATRWEVLVHAWLRLCLEPIKSESTAGHYRIEWTGGHLYFPPKDPGLFEKAVRKFCPRLPGNE